MRRGDILVYSWFCILFDGVGDFSSIDSASGVTSVNLYCTSRDVSSLVVFARIRKCGCDDFCLFGRLFNSFRMVFSRPPIC